MSTEQKNGQLTLHVGRKLNPQLMFQAALTSGPGMEDVWELAYLYARCWLADWALAHGEIRS